MIMVIWFGILVVIRLTIRIQIVDQRCERHFIIQTYITPYYLYFSAALSYINRLYRLLHSSWYEYLIARKKRPKYLAFLTKKIMFPSVFFLMMALASNLVNNKN